MRRAGARAGYVGGSGCARVQMWPVRGGFARYLAFLGLTTCMFAAEAEIYNVVFPHDFRAEPRAFLDVILIVSMHLL